MMLVALGMVTKAREAITEGFDFIETGIDTIDNYRKDLFCKVEGKLEAGATGEPTCVEPGYFGEGIKFAKMVRRGKYAI